LTLRTFHVGGVAGNISEENSLISRFDGLAEIEDLKVVKSKDNEGKSSNIVISTGTVSPCLLAVSLLKA
jgi:DNA-directed RNA polymerase subunit beta'